MLLKIDSETVDFVCKHKITFNQLAICLFVLRKDVTSIIKIKHNVGYIGDCLIPLTGETATHIQEMDDLVNRKFLIRKLYDKNEPYAFDTFDLNPGFKKEFRTPEEIGEEFFNSYPKTIIVNGVELSARTCDFQEMIAAYFHAIKGGIRLHENIVNLLKEKGGYATVGIMKYIGGRVWETDEVNTKVKSRAI